MFPRQQQEKEEQEHQQQSFFEDLCAELEFKKHGGWNQEKSQKKMVSMFVT